MTQLRVLKQGMSGDDVGAWQKFLAAQGFTPDDTGMFGDSTVQATVDFQRLHEIDGAQAGRADNLTVGTAMTLGYKIIPDDTE